MHEKNQSCNADLLYMSVEAAHIQSNSQTGTSRAIIVGGVQLVRRFELSVTQLVLEFQPELHMSMSLGRWQCAKFLQSSCTLFGDHAECLARAW